VAGGTPERRVAIGAGDGCIRATFQAMGSPCELLCETGSHTEARRVAEAVAAEAWRIEDKFSRYIAGNVVDRINSSAGRPVAVDGETAKLIEFSETLHELSGGRFDITSGALRRVWSFDGSDKLPPDDAVLRVLDHVGWHKADWTGDTIALPSGMEVDLGGVGKEYAVDRAAEIARNASGNSCLVNFGGDLALSAPPVRKVAWQVGIDAPGDDAVVIKLSAGALATSGDSRRYLLRDGVRYGHVLDPMTGWPVRGAPESMTVAADTCVQAGMLCTLAMLRGESAEVFLDDQAIRYWSRRA